MLVPSAVRLDVLLDCTPVSPALEVKHCGNNLRERVKKSPQRYLQAGHEHGSSAAYRGLDQVSEQPSNDVKETVEQNVEQREGYRLPSVAVEKFGATGDRAYTPSSGFQDAGGCGQVEIYQVPTGHIHARPRERHNQNSRYHGTVQEIETSTYDEKYPNDSHEPCAEDEGSERCATLPPPASCQIAA